MLRIKAVEQITGLSRSTIYDYVAKGQFPRQVKLGTRCVAWVDDEVAAWLESRIMNRDADNNNFFNNKAEA